MADLYCSICGGDIIPVHTTFGLQHQCAACSYITVPLRIIDWRSDCPICFIQHTGSTIWDICKKCSHAICGCCYDKLTKCAFCASFAFQELQTNFRLPTLQQEYFAKLTILIRITYHEFVEYLIWLLIRKNHSCVSPPERIDTIWRTHITDTRNYRKCCTKLIGKFIECDPAAALDPAIKKQRLHNTHKRYFEIHKEMIAESYKLWEMPDKPPNGRPVVGTVKLCIIHQDNHDNHGIPLIIAMTTGELKDIISKMKNIHHDRITLHKNNTTLHNNVVFRGGDDIVEICAMISPE